MNHDLLRAIILEPTSACAIILSRRIDGGNGLENKN